MNDRPLNFFNSKKAFQRYGASNHYLTYFFFICSKRRVQPNSLRRLFFLKLTCLEVFEACYMSSICHGIWVVRQYDILVLTNDNYILLMTRPMPGPDKQFLSQMKQLKLTFLHVDWRRHLRRRRDWFGVWNFQQAYLCFWNITGSMQGKNRKKNQIPILLGVSARF